MRGAWQARQSAVGGRRPATVVASAQRACGCLRGVSCAPTEPLPVQRLHVPHSWFAHFYVLGCFCNGKPTLYAPQVARQLIRAVGC